MGERWRSLGSFTGAHGYDISVVIDVNEVYMGFTCGEIQYLGGWLKK